MNARRRFLTACAGGTALALVQPAWAAWPERAIRFVVPFPAGGPADAIARLFAGPLSQRLGVPVVVDNRPGASTLIGATFVANAAPDGYNLLLGTSSMNMLVLRKQGSPVDSRKDLAPVIAFTETVYAVLAGPSAPFKTMAEMIAYARQNPGKVTVGNTGTGTTPHLVGEYLNSAAGIKTLAVPYKGAAPMGVGLMGGETMLALDSLGAGVNTLVRSGKVSVLATTGAQRAPALPTVPTVAETVPGFVARGNTGVFTSPGTPADIVNKINAALVSVVAIPEVRERLAAMSHNPVSTTPAEYQKLVSDEIDQWGRVMRESGVVIE